MDQTGQYLVCVQAIVSSYKRRVAARRNADGSQRRNSKHVMCLMPTAASFWGPPPGRLYSSQAIGDATEVVAHDGQLNSVAELSRPSQKRAPEKPPVYDAALMPDAQQPE